MNGNDNSTGQVPYLGFNDQQYTVLNGINNYVNYVSLAAAFLVVVIMLALWLYDKKLVDRVSLRLNVLISVTDLLKSAGLVVFTIAEVAQSGLSCQISPILVVWSMNQYIFLTTCIAFNLQYLFLLGKPFNPYYERWYYILSIGLSFLTGILPFIGGVFGYDLAQQACWYTPSYTTISQIWEYSTLLIPNIAATSYCIVVFIMVVHKIQQENRTLESQLNQPSGFISSKTPTAAEQQLKKSKKAINRAVRRIILYLTIPPLTQLGFLASEIWMYVHLEASYALNLWGIPMVALAGLLNLAAFLLDPAILNAIDMIKRDLIARYGEESVTTANACDSKNSVQKHSFMHWFVRNCIGSTRQIDGSAFYRMNESPDKGNMTELSTITTLDSKIESAHPSPSRERFHIEPELDSPPRSPGLHAGGSGGKRNANTDGAWKRVAKGFISNL
ncbi:hypothetical protein BC937DRAFT_94081 [Endogone sp. FLAS-F59071]|nr:hypothetical protein BC937DRAFT_94081 [Endogone sp. FLAS-F59071]|eukprot:RUS14265.1 hypothetical protein BC937DRAFT_94081 [Endogone sp. FLAS-F59071]